MNKFICTKEKPFPRKPTYHEKWEHPDAIYEGDYDYEDGTVAEEYYCPNCKLTFYVELPQ